jgi:hypothetical protein
LMEAKLPEIKGVRRAEDVALVVVDYHKEM